MILTIDQARALTESTMAATGHSATEAATIADHLIDCELRGLSFGGLPRALSVAERIRATPTPRRPITLLRESPVSAVLDGGDQVGYLVASRATDIAIEKARKTGIAVVGASKTWYTGMFSYYLERITAAGFAGLVAGSGGQKVAPHGGTEGRFSTNPIAFGFPSTGTPVIWDVGTSSVMLGEVVLAQRLGQLLPEGRAFDPEGKPTRDPSAALAGAFTVWGGHKGSGLAMVVQLLGMMAGQATAPESLRDCGFFMVVVDPALLDVAGDYRARVADYADSLRATRPADPAQPVRVPFERSAAERARRIAANAIEVPDAVYHALRDIASQPMGQPAPAGEASLEALGASAAPVASAPVPRLAPMKIGVIGAGFIGRALARLAVQGGHEVMISNSRGPQTLGSTAVAIGCRTGTTEQAAAFGDVVFVAIPFNAHPSLPPQALAGKIVVDANNYYPHRDGHIAVLDTHEATTSGLLQQHLPESRVVKAFNAILQADLEKDVRPAGAPDRRALPLAGDDAEAKRVVAGLQDAFGFDVVDAGSLAESWRFERAKPAYCIPLNTADLKRALAAAERGVELPHGSWRR